MLLTFASITAFVDLLKSVTADSNLIRFGRLYRSAIDHHRHSTNYGQFAIGMVVSLESEGTDQTAARRKFARCTTFLQTPNQLVSPHTRMSLQLENRWRENTHHYVRWSDDSRQVIRLYKPRLQQQLVLSPRCGHLKGNGGVKAAVRFAQRLTNQYAYVARFDIRHYYESRSEWWTIRRRRGRGSGGFPGSRKGVSQTPGA